MLNICKSIFLSKAVSLLLLGQKGEQSGMFVPCPFFLEERILPWRHYYILDHDDP